MLDRGANPNLTAVNGARILLYCIRYKRPLSVIVLLQKAWQCGLDLAYRDRKGDGCLHLLTSHATVSMAEAFLQAVQDGSLGLTGLDTGQPNKDGMTPWDILDRQENPHVRNLMRRALTALDAANGQGSLDATDAQADDGSTAASDEECFVDALEASAPGQPIQGFQHYPYAPDHHTGTHAVTMLACRTCSEDTCDGRFKPPVQAIRGLPSAFMNVEWVSDHAW